MHVYTQVNEQFRKGMYKKQKRQDWDHKAYMYLMHQVLYNVHVTLFMTTAQYRAFGAP